MQGFLSRTTSPHLLHLFRGMLRYCCAVKPRNVLRTKTGWAANDRICIFGWTVPLSPLYYSAHVMQEGAAICVGWRCWEWRPACILAFDLHQNQWVHYLKTFFCTIKAERACPPWETHLYMKWLHRWTVGVCEGFKIFTCSQITIFWSVKWACCQNIFPFVFSANV